MVNISINGNIVVTGDNNFVSGGDLVINGKSVRNGAGFIQGNGVLATKEESLSEFDGIEITGSMNVIYNAGVPAGYRITADENLLDLVQVKVVAGFLSISVNGNFSTSNPITVECGSQMVSAVELCGSGTVNLSGIDTPNFKAGVSGSGSIKATGKTENLIVIVAGSGDVELLGLHAANSDLCVNGSGDIFCTTDVKVHAKVNGSGDILINGAPSNVKQVVNGSGSIRLSNV